MFESNAAEVIGRRVGNYVVERTLAQGGMGSVFVARHPTLGREAAVKFLGHDFEAPPELTKRFLDEARITANLRHPNIVDIFDFGELDGRLYYVMELLDGRDLAAEIRRQGRIAAFDALDMLAQIAAGLAAAHAAGIVHRDLKPANVFVLAGDPLRIKLMDFGIAKVLSSGGEHTSYGQIMGTPRYMSPEQALGQVDRISPQSDIYSLGIIAYEMLTGVAPFENDSPVMLLIMHVRDPFRPVIELAPECPVELAKLVESCLSKEPNERPRSANDIVEQLASMRRRSGVQPKVESRGRSEDETGPAIALVRRPGIGEDDTLRDKVILSGKSEPIPESLPDICDQGHFVVAASSPGILSTSEDATQTTSTEVGSQQTPVTPLARSAVGEAKPATPTPSPALPPLKAIPVSPVIAYREPTAEAPVQSDVRAEPTAKKEAPAAVHLTEGDRNVLNKLLMRMQRKGDFPAFVQNVGEVSKRADFESSFSAQQLGSSILKDYALTAKLLRIVNSTYASRFGGKIYSIQHAIVILGFERVRQLALSISLFKNKGNKEHTERVSESAINSLVSGEISRHLHADADIDDPEQAVICAMFRNLGRHLVLVYLPELYDQIQFVMTEEKVSLNTATERVLGISMHKLGVGIAERWRLPQRMIQAMAAIPERSGRLHREEDRLSALAEFSNQLCEIVAGDLDGASRSRALNALTSKHKHLLTVKTEDMTELLMKVQESFEHRYHSLLGDSTKTSRFSQNVSQLVDEAGAILEGEKRDIQAQISHLVLETPSALPEPLPEPLPKPPAVEVPQVDQKPEGAPGAPVAQAVKPKRAVERLQLAKVTVDAQDAGAAGIFARKLTSIREECERNGPSETLLTSLLAAIAELLHVSRLLLLRSTSNHRELFVCAGLGEDVEGLAKELRFPLAPARAAADPFSVAYHVNRSQCIEDCFATKVTNVMPARYYELLGSASLVLVHVPVKTGLACILAADFDPPGVMPSPSALQSVTAAKELLAQLAMASTRPSA